MNAIEDLYNNNYYSDINKVKLEIPNKYSYDNMDYKSKSRIKSSLSKKKSKQLFYFISSKNRIKLESDFDRKGAKKFLNEKSKAMEEIVLIDENTDDEHNHKKKSPHKKKHNNKLSKVHHSHNALLKLKIHKFSSKKNCVNKEHKKKSSLSSHTLGLYCISDVKDIGKIKNKKSNKKASIESIKFKSSVFNKNEPSYLMTSENDSFINSIVKQIDESKN